jgi:transposase
VAEELKFKRQTIRSTVKVYLTTGRVQKSNVRGKPPQKFRRYQANTLKDFLIQSYNYIGGYKSKFDWELNISVALNTIRKYLNEIKITLKRTNLVLERVNDEERLE